VHEYYSVARFRAAYEGRVEPMTDRSQWPEVNLGFKVYPPLLGRAPGRPKVQRQRGCLEKNANKKKVRCKRCGGFGHFAKTCKLDMVGEDGETATKKGKKVIFSFNYFMLSVLSIIHYYLLKNCMYRKRTECAGDDAGPSKGKKKKTAKKKTPKNKKKPLKKKQKKDAAAPPAKVVRNLKDLFSDEQ